mgnify:CR=1 FL=1
MTGCEREYLEMVSRTSPEVFRQMTLCLGHTELMAEKRRVRSSFLASSSTADLWPHSLSNTWVVKNKINFNIQVTLNISRF